VAPPTSPVLVPTRPTAVVPPPRVLGAGTQSRGGAGMTGGSPRAGGVTREQR
jgi:hypothetical protein